MTSSNFISRGSGGSPIYDLKGDFLGTDDEGFEGEILFMDRRTFTAHGGYNNGTDNSKKGGISHKNAKMLGQNLKQVIGSNPAKDFTQADIDMVNNAITHVVSQMGDYGKELQLMPDGKSSSYFAIQVGEANNFSAIASNSGNPYNWDTWDSPAFFNEAQQKMTYNITSRVWRNTTGFTVHNIQNTAVHEIGGHMINKFPGGEVLGHRGAYELQMSHSTWSKTTNNFKNEILNGKNRIK